MEKTARRTERHRRDVLTLKEIAEQLKKLRSAVIFCHMRPDGDTLGSAMGLSWLLRQNGARCSVVCESEIPEKFHFLEGMGSISRNVDSAAEAYIAVDCSEEHRMGTLGETFRTAKKPKFNIDHHISNTRFADHNFVEERAATCEIVTELSAFFDFPLSPLAANYLMLGLSSDTGNFAHKNVTESTFLAAARLVSFGADVNEIQYYMFKRQSAARALLFGRTMSTIRYFEEGKIAFISVTRAQLDACGAKSDVTEGFIDFPLTVDGVDVAVCLLEVADERFKISLRSKGATDVNAVAAVYGGGGHTLASGCMISGCLEEVIDKLRFTIKQHMAL